MAVGADPPGQNQVRGQLGEHIAEAFGLADVSLRRGQIDMPRSAHDLGDVIAADCTPSDPCRSQASEHELLSPRTVGEQVSAVDPRDFKVRA